MSLLSAKSYFNKDYSPALDYAHKQELMHWYPEKVPMREDLLDYRKLPPAQRAVLDNILRFFTQGDINIAGAYIENYLQVFKDPSIRCMLLNFAAMEAIHVKAYAYLLNNLNIPESEFKAFLEYEEMVNKHNYLAARKIDKDKLDTESIALDIAIFSAFGEGLQLYSSFAVLLSFCNTQGFKGLDSIVRWSAKDEACHVEGMVWLYRTLIKENPSIYTDKFRGKVYQACRDMVDLEMKFIDLVYSTGEIPSLEKEDLKLYIQYLADRRLLQLGLKPNYGVKDNPLPWMEFMLNAVSYENFFEVKSTSYANTDAKKWEDIF